MSVRIETFKYDDAIVRKFAAATVLWGIVGMLVGVIVALELVVPEANLGQFWLTFGRLRPLHTNAVIFAFAGNALFAAVYYSSQRLLKARMFSDALSSLHFWGWQLIIVSAAVTLPLGFTTGKEYAELEWPIDLAIAVVWVVFAVNFFGTLWRRRERHLYVAIWFYIASIVTVAVLHIFNSLEVPAGPFKSYSVYAGAQDAFMQWWYGHNAVAFFLTTPFLGLMYYFLPKAADRPVFSYRLSILHFWAIVFLYIWAGPHHLHYTATPEWAATLGMLFSLMLWMPSWGGMVNGLLTLRGAWNKVAQDPVLKFFVAGVTFYGLSTFEGPLLSIKSVNALSHYTDWTIAHVHGGALGWNGLMIAGMLYWLGPRLFQTKAMWSKKLMTIHFWTALVGLLLYVVSMWVAGVTQGLMWRQFDESGRLANPDFVETVQQLRVMYFVRLGGGIVFLGSMVLLAVNFVMTWLRRPAEYAEPVYEAPALEKVAPEPTPVKGGLWQRIAAARWHRRWEALPVTFTVLTTVAVVVASLFEIIPTFLIKSNIPTIASVHPYTPLELYGRDVYLREGCYNCHSQMVRPIRSETERYGEYSKAGEFVFDHPFQWGSRRIGPDLHRVGGKYNHLWHVTHMENPRVVPGSIMPAYPWMLEDPIDFAAIPARVRAMARIGVPYGDAVDHAEALAREQADGIAREIVDQGGPEGLGDKDIVALIAYLQRLGTDIKNAPTPASPPRLQAAAPEGAAGADRKEL
ncbi:MAG: cytochrome-c oxidase, cbb3-type subunit I [Myxococcales bacterium]|nr:cytochrome-c oxidase, cbb3-type subunit I [Myxococcales bacterium]